MDRRKFIGALASASVASGIVATARTSASIPAGMVSAPFPAFPDYVVEVNTEAYRSLYPHMKDSEFRRMVSEVFGTLSDHLADFKPGDAFIYDPKFITVRRLSDVSTNS